MPSAWSQRCTRGYESTVFCTGPCARHGGKVRGTLEFLCIPLNPENPSQVALQFLLKPHSNASFARSGHMVPIHLTARFSGTIALPVHPGDANQPLPLRVRKSRLFGDGVKSGNSPMFRQEGCEHQSIWSCLKKNLTDDGKKKKLHEEEKLVVRCCSVARLRCCGWQLCERQASPKSLPRVNEG